MQEQSSKEKIKSLERTLSLIEERERVLMEKICRMRVSIRSLATMIGFSENDSRILAKEVKRCWEAMEENGLFKNLDAAPSEAIPTVNR